MNVFCSDLILRKGVTMQNTNEAFLKKWAEIENDIKQLPDAPADANMKWYEDRIEDNEKKNKLYLCRVCRNYLSHNPDKHFINVTSEMIEFLCDIQLEIRNQLDIIKVRMISKRKSLYVNLTDNILATIDLMKKKNISMVPVLNEKGAVLGIFSKDCIFKHYGEFTKAMTFKKFIDLEECHFINEMTLCEDTAANTFYCVLDKNNKFVGTYQT